MAGPMGDPCQAGREDSTAAPWSELGPCRTAATVVVAVTRRQQKSTKSGARGSGICATEGSEALALDRRGWALGHRDGLRRAAAHRVSAAVLDPPDSERAGCHAEAVSPEASTLLRALPYAESRTECERVRAPISRRHLALAPKVVARMGPSGTSRSPALSFRTNMDSICARPTWSRRPPGGRRLIPVPHLWTRLPKMVHFRYDFENGPLSTYFQIDERTTVQFISFSFRSRAVNPTAQNTSLLLICHELVLDALQYQSIRLSQAAQTGQPPRPPARQDRKRTLWGTLRILSN